MVSLMAHLQSLVSELQAGIQIDLAVHASTDLVTIFDKRRFLLVDIEEQVDFLLIYAS